MLLAQRARMTPATLVVAAMGCLAAGIALQAILAPLGSPRVKGLFALLSAVLALFAVAGLVPAVCGGAVLEARLGVWDGPLELVLHVDALAVLFAGMATGIGAAVLLYSVGYMARDRSCTRFYALMLCFIGGLLGLVFSANLFLVYAFWELVGLCSFGLVGFWYRQEEAVKGARKVLLMTHLAGYGLFVAVLLLYLRTGTALLGDPRIATGFSSGVFVLMLLALCAKSVQFPLHTWIPEAMAAPTPVSALLHAACYVKAGVYLAARMHCLGPWAPSWGAAMVAVGTVTMVVGALFALVQGDLKRMLAFSTVSQIGYMITGLGIGTPLGITAALLHCINHGFFKGGLFLAAGSVQHASGTRDMDRLGGLAQRMPRTTAAWLLSAGSMVGVPLMSGFASKWMLYSAALQAGLVVPALAAWLTSVGTVFYCAKATSAVFLGPPGEASEHAHESPPSMQWGLFALAAGSVVLSVAPQLPVNYLVTPVLASLGLGPGIEVSWFGLLGPAGAWWSTTGLALAVVSVALGALVYALARPARMVAAGSAVAGGGVFTGGEALGAGDGRLSAADFSEILRQYLAPFYRLAEVDRAYRAGYRALRAAAEWVWHLARRAEGHAFAVSATLAVVLLAVAAAPQAEFTRIAEHTVALPTALLAGCAVACGGLVLTALGVPSTRGAAAFMVLAAAAALAGLAARVPITQLALSSLAAAMTLALVWRHARSPATRLTYLAVVVVSAAALIGGHLALQGGEGRVARALIVGGFCLKLGAVPLFLWLPRIADDLPALVLGFVVAVLDIAAFGELWVLARIAPWILEPRGLWLGIAMGSTLLGALLMVAERDLRRLLVFSTVEDLGFLLLGVSAGGAPGLSGAAWGAVVHALAKALLFASLAAPEADGRLSAEPKGLAAEYPLSGAAFLVGMLAVLGVPPTLGFAGRWRLYGVALELGPAVLATFVLASGMALVAYVQCLARTWWGPPASVATGRREPPLVRAALAVLCALLVLAGACPAVLEALTGRIP